MTRITKILVFGRGGLLCLLLSVILQILVFCGVTMAQQLTLVLGLAAVGFICIDVAGYAVEHSEEGRRQWEMTLSRGIATAISVVLVIAGIVILVKAFKSGVLPIPLDDAMWSLWVGVILVWVAMGPIFAYQAKGEGE